MTIRLASFNVENLFARAKALNLTTWAEGQPVLAAFDQFNTIIGHAEYSEQDKADMLTALAVMEILTRDRAGRLVMNPDPFSAWALLRENRGDFIKQPRNGDAEIVASGRSSWIGWAELITEPVDETATRMTAKVINEVAADVQCVVEAEDRPSLVRFNEELLGSRYGHTMLVDGNDPRGIDVGLFCVKDIEIRSV